MASGRQTRITSMGSSKNLRSSRIVRQPCFTLKRPLVFQVRKALVEYVDDELLNMSTSVFYQRIFILAKNIDPNRESFIAKMAAHDAEKLAKGQPGEMDALRMNDAINADHDDQHYSQATTVDSAKEGKGDANVEDSNRQTVTIMEPPGNPDTETVTRTFRFDWNDEAAEEEELAEEESEPEPDVPEGPKDMYTLFVEKLQALQKKCRYLSYTPDPMCGLFIYMNEYTMLMLESGEDMMGVFCGELVNCIDEFWQSNRVVLIEDHIQELYTKELVFRRIHAAHLNEKFPPSTPTDEYLMGKQHLIIKDKMHTICGLISESLEPSRTTEIFQMESSMSEQDLGEVSDEEQHFGRVSSQVKRMTSIVSNSLAPEVYRKLLPEIQRIELVLASTRFYYTLEEFYGLYGKVPFAPDDDGYYWPIQNNYAPPNIFQRTPYDINLTFAEYAAEMNRRMQEEQEQNKAELEAAAAAEAHAAEQAKGQQQPQHIRTSKQEEPEE